MGRGTPPNPRPNPPQRPKPPNNREVRDGTPYPVEIDEEEEYSCKGYCSWGPIDRRQEERPWYEKLGEQLEEEESRQQRWLTFWYLVVFLAMAGIFTIVYFFGEFRPV